MDRKEESLIYKIICLCEVLAAAMLVFLVGTEEAQMGAILLLGLAGYSLYQSFRNRDE